MIDTFHILLKDLSISKANLTIEEPRWNYRTGQTEEEFPLFRDIDTGQLVYAKKAYLNHEKFNLTITPNRYTLINSELSSVCIVSLSIPRYAYGKNTEPAPHTEFINVLRNLELVLKENGVKTNIENSEVSRVDIFKNVRTEYEFQNYLSVLSLLDFKSIKNHRDYGTTLLNHNGQRQFAIYDKVEEENIKNKLCKDYNYDNTRKHNIVRFEYRLLRSASVRAQVGFREVKEFIKNPKEIENAFYEYTTSIFGKDPENVVSPIIENVKQGLLFYKTKHPNDSVGLFIRNEIGIANLEKQIGVETFIKMLKETHNRQTAYDWKKRIKSAIKESRLSKINLSNNETYASLYREVKTKLLLRAV